MAEYLQTEYEIIPKGDNPIVNAQYVQCADDRLDEVLRSIGNDTETADGRISANENNIANNTTAISGLDTRVTVLEESGGSQGPPGPEGPQGPKGDKGDAGTNGTSAYWFTGTDVTGTAESVTVSVSGSKAYDMYLNTSTWNVYTATAANTWKYCCNIRGAAGQNATTTAVATTTSNGLMSYNDKTILNALDSKIYKWFSSGNCSLLSGNIYVIGAQIHIDCVVTCKWAVSQYWDLVKLPFNIKSPAGSGNRYTNTTAGYYITDNSAQIMANKAFAKSDTITLNLILTKYGFITS